MVVGFIRVTFFSFLLVIITGLVYPLFVTVIAQNIFPHQANGSLIEKDGKVIGSELIGQNFAGEGYFHPRPSAAGNGYAADNSGASNLGATSAALLDTFRQRVEAENQLNGYQKLIPADLIMGSGSGLDPDITPEAAYYQADRIARTRNLSPEQVNLLINKYIMGRTLGVLGMPRVNVLAINMELDKMAAQSGTQ